MMCKQWFPLVVVAFIAGCSKQPSAVFDSDGNNRVQVSIGGDDEESPHLSFKITEIYENRTPTADAPFHAAGGDWTFFDCQSSNNPQVIFTVGVFKKSDAWGRAILIVKDREAGGRFVEAFSKSFPGTLPKPVEQPYVFQPLFINTALLGSNIDRHPQGGFSGTGGGWTATKWFPSNDGQEGEIYFNFNLSKREGEFSEKDAEYADDLLAIFASALRDGPRPERTPENDPNLTRTGPTIGQPRKLLSRLTAHYSFNAKGSFAVYQDGPKILAVPLDKADAPVIEIAQFDYSPWEVHVLSDDLDLIVQEGVAESPGVKSSADPMRIWWVDHSSKEKKLLRGPEKDLNLAEVPVSPDHRYVALHQWRDNPRGKGRSRVLIIFDRQTGTSTDIDPNGKNLNVVGWKDTESSLRGIAVSNRWKFKEDEASELFLVDPATGRLERQETTDPRQEIDNVLSPDQKHRVRVEKDELVVTDLGNGSERRFVFHEDDRRFVGEGCVEWVSPRYLRFDGTRLALIDVNTMKMCFPALADKSRFPSPAYKFSSDFRWVLYQGESMEDTGLFLAPVEVPSDQ